MTLQDRVDAYKATFQRYPASWPWVASEKGQPVLYAVWVLGSNYRAKAGFYGEYPPGYLARVMALFPDAVEVLHACSGSLPPGDYTRLDLNPARQPDIIGSIQDVHLLFGRETFDLVLADIPYSDTDAERYETPPVNRRLALQALHHVVKTGQYLVWLDTTWPMYSKQQWRTAGRIAINRSINHRVRMAFIFERQ